MANQGYYGGHPPQGGYPPQQNFGGPPQQNFGGPPQQQFGQQPPYGGYGAPQQGYGPPPGQYPPPQHQQSFAAPPHQQSFAGGYQQGPPPMNAYNAPPQHTGPPTPASPGYLSNHVPHTDMTQQAVALRDAMKGFGTNEKVLIQVLSQVPDGPHMNKLRHTFNQQFRRDLLKDIKSESSGYFEEGLLAIARGPLDQDVYCVDRALRGMGTKENLLNDVVLGRSNADLNAIKAQYHQTFGKDLAKEVREDLSMKTEKLFEYVLSARRAEESAPVYPQETEHAVDRLQQSTQGQIGTNQEVVCQVLAFSSDGQLRAISQRYHQKYQRKLDDVLKSEFSGHMQDALRLILARAEDRVKSDADDLEATMKGPGTKDQLLVSRLVRAHWNREHMRQVGVAYQRFHGRNLRDRIKGETSGHYRDLMMALCV